MISEMSILIVYISIISIIHSSFIIQPYELPAEQGRRHTTAIISDNTLYLVGGLNRFGPGDPSLVQMRDIYSLDLDESNPQWQFLNSIPEDVMTQPWFTTVRGMLKINNNLYVACHDARDGKVYSFDQTTGTFTVISVIPFDFTEDCCAIGIRVNSDDRIYITGGVMPTGQQPTDQVIYYSITESKWYEVDKLNTARSHHACTAVADRKLLYILGGANRYILQVKTSIEVYDIDNDNWIEYENVLSPERRSFGAVTIPGDDAIILIAGDERSAGDPNGAVPLSLVQVLDIQTNTIIFDEDIPQLNFARVSPAITLGVYDCDDKDSEPSSSDDYCYSIFVVAGSDSSGVRRDTERWDFTSVFDDENEDDDNEDDDNEDDDNEDDENEDNGFLAHTEKDKADLYDMEQNNDTKQYTLNVIIDGHTLINIWSLLGVILVVNITWCCLCNKKNNESK